MDKNKTKKLSKFLSLILRHKPEVGNIVLDNEGWTSIATLIEKNPKYTMEILEDVVATNNKKRFAFNEDKTMIRASQGHSLKLDIKFEKIDPPDYLYHGTASRFIESIMSQGLKSMNRHHVHMTDNLTTAQSVGSRYGTVVVLKIDCKAMEAEGFTFYKSANGVFLTDSVPCEFLSTLGE